MKFTTLLFLLLIFNITRAEISPYYKEVMQRGYTLSAGDSVIFPDGSGCKIEEFNNQTCGKEWFDKPFCVAMGKSVWDEGVCCEGLEPQLATGVDGQATCEEIENSWFSSKSVLYFFIGVLIPLGLFVFLAYKAKKGLPKNKD